MNVYGPVRENPETRQCETLRIPLGRCLPHIQTFPVDPPVPGKKLLASRWFIAVDTLRIIANSYQQECGGLDDPAKPPTKWVIILVDQASSKGSSGTETRSIDDLLDYIEAKDPVRSKKLRKKPAPKAQADPSQLGPSTARPSSERVTSSAAAAAAAAAAAVSGDPALQVKAAAELLALAAKQSNFPRKFAAALAAAELAADLPIPGLMASSMPRRARGFRRGTCAPWRTVLATGLLCLLFFHAAFVLPRPVSRTVRTARQNWVDEFQDFRDSGYDVAKLMLKKATEPFGDSYLGFALCLLAASRTLSDGDAADESGAAGDAGLKDCWLWGLSGALHAIRDMLGSQEGILQRELTGLRSQLSALDSRFSQEREGLLGKRLTAALKQERELKFALETARQQYETELETLQDSESKLKRQVQDLVDREQELKNADVVRPKDMEEVEALRKERDELLQRLEMLPGSGTTGVI
eukprot:s463_g13.t1